MRDEGKEGTKKEAEWQSRLAWLLCSLCGGGRRGGGGGWEAN